MRTAYWDTGDPEIYFGNPNLYWGDPGYLLEPGDPRPWPAGKAIWTYKAIYRADDAQVGRWSQTVSVTVGN